MHNNPVLIARYAKNLSNAISSSTLTQCISTSLSSVFFRFSNDFVLNVEFVLHHTLFLTPDLDHFPKRNTLPQFKELVGEKVIEVLPTFPDRSIQIAFKSNISIHINVYGRHAGIISERNGKVVDSFKYKNPPSVFESSDFKVGFAKDRKEFQQLNRFVTDQMVAVLEKTDFFTAEESDQLTKWDVFLDSLEEQPLHLYLIDSKPFLSIYENDSQDVVYNNDIQAHNDFARRLTGYLRFSHLFLEINSELEKRKKHIVKSLKSAQVRISKMPSALELRQFGDILMANMHSMEIGLDSVDLLNFYTNETCTIRLKKDLSPQKNAERYYRKAKNTHIEEDHLKTLTSRLESSLSKTTSLSKELHKANTHKQLTSLYKRCDLKGEKAIEQESVPYKRFEKDGFQIWVGKSATANDELFKLGGKNDMWLHAREVAGSHVIIRNPEDKKLSVSLLEYAASLAAGYSKNQHESLAAVAYTQIKYVRKFKGANPGQVRIEREEVILIEPKKA